MKTNEQRFWEKVDKNGPVPSHAPELGPCWVWTAGKFDSGYPVFHVRKDGAFKLDKAHRFSWEVHFGPIPRGKFVCHKCDNPACVNPRHLFVGTQLANISDAVRKNRMCRKGNPRIAQIGRESKQKLDRTKANEIRQLFGGGVLRSDIAKRFGLSWSTIDCVVKSVRWN